VNEPLERVLELRARADYEGARREALTGLEAPSFDLLIELGRLQHDLGREDEAEVTFERAAEVADRDLQRSRACARLVGVYRDQGRAHEAEAKAREALTLAGEEDSLERADALVALADTQRYIGELAAAGDGCRRALPIADGAAPGLERDRVRVRIQAGLGNVLRARGRYDEAEPILREVIAAAEEAFVPESLETADALNDLGIVFKYAGRFDDAEPLYRRALAINERAVGEEHYNVASLYHNLGGLDHARGNYEQAEPHARRSVEIRRRLFGRDHPATAADEAALASILYALRKDEEAEKLLRGALPVYERVFGDEHYEVSVHLNNLAAILQRRGADDEAESLYRRSLAMKEKLVGSEHPVIANTLNNLAVICKRQERFDEAEELYRRALEILEAGVEPGHPTLATTRRNYDALLRAMGHEGRKKDADKPV
jgi:tetratricopeptide (TPR) repeat protein